MRAIHAASALALFALLLIAPSQVQADHCGASGTITPSHGPPGTTFVFRTNLGASSDLSLYRNGSLVRSVALPGDGFVRYAIRTEPGDAGTWRARAVVRGSPDCAAEVTFAVGGPPDTATSSHPLLPTEPGGAPVSLILVAAGLAAFLVGLLYVGVGRRVPSELLPRRQVTFPDPVGHDRLVPRCPRARSGPSRSPTDHPANDG